MSARGGIQLGCADSMSNSRFDEQLRRHLENVRDEPRAGAEPGFRLDVAQLRQHFLQRLRRREQYDPDWVKHMHREWSSELEAFARYIEDSGEPDVLEEVLTPQAYAANVLDAALSCIESTTPLVTRLELERVSAGFVPARIAAYCLETGLTRREREGAPRITTLGRIFLRLRGKDALRWVLTVEVSQSRGDEDPWRASRHLLEEALETKLAPVHDMDGHEYFPFAQASLERLCDFGVLRALASDPTYGAEIWEYSVPGPMEEVVRAARDNGPWHAAVTALLEDQRLLVLPVSGPTATEATIEQTRLIAHEVRNALGPVRYNVDELLSEALEAPHRARVEAARKGVARVLDFVDQMVSTSEMITEPSTTFDVAGLIREAIGWIDGSDGVELDLPEHPLRLRAPRPRFLRALLDVIRNALQSATPPPPVRISARRCDREVRIVVDDGGPGVPAELRTRVFDDGFTTRPGGSGFGLAFLRQVVERELRGTVSCEEADLGGARFTISISDSESES